MDAEREYIRALADGDQAATADYRRWSGAGRHDVVADCPASKLADLAEDHPELAAEIAARRGEDLMQL